MADVLTRVGWVDGQVVLAEDMIELEDNIEAALQEHNHGDGTVVPVLAQNIPAPTGSIGLPSNPNNDPTVSSLRDHLTNSAIHYRPNQNLPGWLTGTVSIPALSGDEPSYTVDVTLDPAFTNTNYWVLLSINYSNATVQELPDSAFLAAEILSASQFRIHARLIFNPFESHKAFQVVWTAIGASSGIDLSLI